MVACRFKVIHPFEHLVEALLDEPTVVMVEKQPLPATTTTCGNKGKRRPEMRLDVKEEGENFTIIADLPGVKKEG